MAKVTYANFGHENRRLNQAQKAFNEVRLLLGKANSALVKCLDSNGQSERDRYTEWFGVYKSANRQVVFSNIHNMLRQLDHQAITINHKGARCRSNYYAYVSTTSVGGGLGSGVTIFLCDKFFTASLYGQYSQVGTIIHEITHLVGGTSDHAYGPDDCQKLAKKHTAKAIMNADNYRFFIESFI